MQLYFNNLNLKLGHLYEFKTIICPVHLESYDFGSIKDTVIKMVSQNGESLKLTLEDLKNNQDDVLV